MARSPVCILAVATLVALGVTPAVAADLTGTWEGTLKCTTYEHGDVPERETNDLTARITQSGTRMNLVFEGFLPLAPGLVFDIGASPDAAAFAFGTCPGEPSGRLGSGKANGERIKGEVTAIGGMASRIVECTFKLRRTDTADPGVTDCPPQP
jgi:hypothetical protein